MEEMTITHILFEIYKNTLYLYRYCPSLRKFSIQKLKIENAKNKEFHFIISMPPIYPTQKHPQTIMKENGIKIKRIITEEKYLTENNIFSTHCNEFKQYIALQEGL